MVERNVLGTPLQPCGIDPVTGFYRDGSCTVGPEDVGVHGVCAVMTAEFLDHQQRVGNDLSTPRPEYRFPGLHPGDRWCVVAARWLQAYAEGSAAPIVLASTHERVLEVVALDALRAHAVDVPDSPAALGQPVFHVVFVEPRIPPNTGNAIRLAAATGAHLHLVEPFGFTMTDARLRRAGLDYHDLATVTVHPGLDALWSAVLPAPAYAFTSSASLSYAEVAYAAGDVLISGPEPTGLSAEVLADPRIRARVRIPMLAGRRSLNLANSAAIAVYEAWRQQGFGGAR